MSAKNLTYQALRADKGDKRKGEHLKLRLHNNSCRLLEFYFIFLDKKSNERFWNEDKTFHTSQK